jgi:hypothetical protein
MARRAIVVRYGDEQTEFKFSRVDRGKLYGRKERVILDENGERCVPAYLTPDGAALVPPGGTAHVYVDERFDHVARGDLAAVDERGEPLELVESTLGEPQDASPSTAARLLDHTIVSVYELGAEELGEHLAQALADGELFELPYNYKAGYDPDVLFLLKNDEGIFGLVGRPTGFELLERDNPVVLEDEDEDEDEDADELSDDLDFSMM